MFASSIFKHRAFFKKAVNILKYYTRSTQIKVEVFSFFSVVHGIRSLFLKYVSQDDYGEGMLPCGAQVVVLAAVIAISRHQHTRYLP